MKGSAAEHAAHRENLEFHRLSGQLDDDLGFYADPLAGADSAAQLFVLGAERMCFGSGKAETMGTAF